LQPPFVGAKCCVPECAAVESRMWCKSQSAETLGQPLCAKCLGKTRDRSKDKSRVRKTK